MSAKRTAASPLESLAADLVYLWSIQYYSTPTIDDRFNYLDHVFSIISELDPRFTDPYEVGALIAVAEAHNTDLAFKILDMGFAKCPDQWLFPFDAGHIALMTLKNYDLAMKYFKACMEIPGSPVFVRRLYANALYKKGDIQTSWETWLEIYKTAPDEPTKKTASNHLYEVKAAIDSGVIAEAVKKYKERFGRLPETLGELIATRLLAKLPRDLDGQDYLYDAKTGSVRTATIPWKR